MLLEAIDDSIWLAEGGNVNFYGFPYPTRSVIIRLADSSLWIWSPIALTEKVQRDVDSLGPVAHLVSPNKIHHLYLQDWHRAYPDALLWGPASTLKKRADLVFAEPLTDKAPAEWRNEIDQFWFRGSFFMDEVVFFHRDSRTVVIADLSENFSGEYLRRYWGWKTIIAKLWKIGVGHGYAPLEWRLSWLNRKPARQALERLISSDPKRVVMAHGEWQRDDGRAYLQRAFSWLA